MSQAWVENRKAEADAMRELAMQSDQAADFLAWERFIRKTNQMEAIADLLERQLPKEYRVAHGLAFVHQGRPIYLEHIVLGPGGIFLLESLKASDEDWQSALEANLAFMRKLLIGSDDTLACLVIEPDYPPGKLPQGAHLIDSVPIAIEVMTAPLVLPKEQLEKVWRTLHRMAEKVETQSVALSSFRLWLVIMLVALFVHTGITITVFGFDMGLWAVGMSFVALPATGLAGVLEFTPVRRWVQAKS